MGIDFKVTINSPERAEEFMKVFGRVEMDVKSPVPHEANLPGKGQARIFELDMDMISEDEKDKLAAHLAEKFKLNIEVVKTELARVGMPILAEDCTVVVYNPQVWFD